MDFLSESWDISEETDSLNRSLFSRSFIPTNSKKEKKKKVKEKKASGGFVGSLEESTDIKTDIQKAKKAKKRKIESVSSDNNAKRKKIRVQSVNSEPKSENKESDSKPTAHQTKKKKKNTKSKNKFKLENCMTRQPGGKNLQRREIKEKTTMIREPANAIKTKEPAKETPVKLVGSNTGASKTGGIKSKHLKKMMSNDEVNRSGLSIKMDKNGENSDVTSENLSKVHVSKKKRKKNKTKTDANSAETLDVKSKITPKTDSNKNLNGKVRKLTFNPAILSKMLASASESKTDSSIENKTESRKKKKRKEMKITKEGDMEKARKKTKIHKEIEFEEEVKVEEARKKKKKQKEINVDEEADLGKAPSKSLSLKERLMEQLNSARFRYINEQLYTQTGQEAQEMFEEDEEAFQVYHQGFQTQVNKWPANPVDLFIKDIKQLPGNKVVADFGCGDAKIARNVPHKVHSFDLVALNDHVTACDMAHVPLGNGSVDVAVFCLSLMGTNLADYLTEAHRVLKTGGQLKIAEVASRFHSLPQFLLKVEQFGFYQVSKDTSNKMFYIFTFKKTGKPKAKAPVLTLEPCVYKKR